MSDEPHEYGLAIIGALRKAQRLRHAVDVYFGNSPRLEFRLVSWYAGTHRVVAFRAGKHKLGWGLIREMRAFVNGWLRLYAMAERLEARRARA